MDRQKMDSSRPDRLFPAAFNGSPYEYRPPGSAQRPSVSNSGTSSPSNPAPSSYGSTTSRYAHDLRNDPGIYEDGAFHHRTQAPNEHSFSMLSRPTEMGLTPPMSSMPHATRHEPLSTDFFDVDRSSAARAGICGRQPAQSSLHQQPIRVAQTPGQWQSSSPLQRDTIGLRHGPPIASGIRLINPRDKLPDRLRHIFPYQFLNAVQSKCFPRIYESDDNVVVSAPTGSGKTVIMELAICRLAALRGNESFKIVYQAPTKALCSERTRDWQKKFSVLNMEVAELTGDTSLAEMKRVGTASIIVTTPEKWDSVTRKWHDYRKLLQLVELFLIDEVHMLKDARGATLEAVVSRMKTIGASVRFVALSATLPNPDDIAVWLGQNHANPQLPARLETFGEDLRPVKLKKYVYGYDMNGNDFIFDRYLSSKLPDLLAKHARSKPVLVFCFTRGSCQDTARKLGECWAASAGENRLWPAPSRSLVVANQLLQQAVRWGVAFHHAGLDPHDRSLVEKSFVAGQISVICCTSTLAVGMNLPCHTVVLKGTCGYQEGGQLKEYSDLEVMQMLGRAGRPQFDDTANAIILTRNQNKARYEQMVSGQEVLESTLHLNLIEHLNSEAVLRTIDSQHSAEKWLKGTFLSVRLGRNPEHYQLTPSGSNVQHMDDTIAEICKRDIELLKEAGLVTDLPVFRSTDYGRAMSSYMVRFDSMKLILDIPAGVGMALLVWLGYARVACLESANSLKLKTLCCSLEFKDQRFKLNEKATYRELNESQMIRYPIKENISETWHKVSLLVQMHLGAVELSNQQDHVGVRRQIMTDKKLVFECMQRLVRCFVDCSGAKHDGAGTRIGLELLRSLAAESWEDRPTQLLQVPGIGPVGMRKLVNQDVRTVKDLANRSYMDIERLLSRKPPFGKKMKDVLDGFPQLTVSGDIVSHKVSPTGVDVNVRASLGYLNPEALWNSSSPRLTFTAETTGGTLVYFWRGTMKKLSSNGGTQLKFSACLDGSDDVICHFSCEEVVGTIVSTMIQYHGPRGNARIQERTPSFGMIEADSPLLSANTAGTLHVGSSSQGALNNQEVEHNREPVQLPNGKWQCSHPCSGGVLTRAGKPCSHPCCRDGAEKKPRRGKRVGASTIKRSNASDGDTEQPSNISPNGGQAQLEERTASRRNSKKQKLSRSSKVSKARPTATKATLRNELFVSSDSEMHCIDLVDVDSDYELDIRLPGQTGTFKAQNKIVSHDARRRSLLDQGTGKRSTTYSHPKSLGPEHQGGRDSPGPPVYEVFDSDDTSQSFGTDIFDELDFALIDKLSPVPRGTAPSRTRLGANGSANAHLVQADENVVGQLSDKTDVMEVSATEPLSRHILDTARVPQSTVGAPNSLPHLKQQDEPAWVQDYDPDLVNSFRGYVKYV